ncbi:hypothetical protein [Rhodoferax ferrireducens]|uniref:hypothetical protein n=1 Tax=Rhodoferax ferrireducens TaxID=192843 RepID=UPI000E0DC784|nr:hypothetical protein [Rhodoferax ferrireducens]
MSSVSRFCQWLVPVLALLAHSSVLAVTALQPMQDDEVLEVLPAVTRSRPPRAAAAPQRADPATLARQAREDIAVARQTGDTRYWGRAQAVLARWWDSPDAPVDLAVLQATVQQGRHEFEASRKVLVTALARAPGHAQGWLNLAALERLSARYAEALAACDAVARAGQALYAAACRLETQSLQGQHRLAVQGLQALIAQTADTSRRSWLLSLLAESQERAGRDRVAADTYLRSLALEADLYTAIAYSDLLLRGGQASDALQVLATLPETDAVVLRRAAAWRRLGDARWNGARTLLQARVAELERRGDDPALHGRELALAALWLDDDAPRALTLARDNLLLQREPLDWWVALQSARRAQDLAALAEFEHAIRAAGLQDVRLSPARPASSPPVARRAK